LYQLTKNEFSALSHWAFSGENPGYQPAVQEASHGDGNWDTLKRYAHVAPKYGLGPFENVYTTALESATLAARALGIAQEYWPGSDSTLRVLHYPPGATTAPHTDFCLFTLSLYRSTMAPFRYLDGACEELDAARTHFPGIHFGELMTEIYGIPATRHEVVATSEDSCSCVFFVMPPLEAVMPGGRTVEQWVAERKARSRREA
jgi:hypothetical protein